MGGIRLRIRNKGIPGLREDGERLKIDHADINVEFDRLNGVITQQMEEIEQLQTQLATAERIMHEALREAAKEVRFTNAEFEAWQTGWADKLATAKLGEVGK